MNSRGQIKDSDLPPDFRSGDLAADYAVRKVLKEISKNEKSKFQIEVSQIGFYSSRKAIILMICKQLLHNIKDPEMDSKVPTLKDLYFRLRNPRRGPKTLTNDALWLNTEIADKSRIALVVS
jgi:hypothetical protein